MHKDLIEFCAKRKMIDWDAYLHEALTMLIHGFAVSK